MSDNFNWDELSERAEAEDLHTIPGHTLHGEAASASGQDALMAATGTTSIDDAKRIALGRPRLDAHHDTTIMWRVRATEQLDNAVIQLAKDAGISRSALIREAVAEYARTHPAA